MEGAMALAQPAYMREALGMALPGTLLTFAGIGTRRRRRWGGALGLVAGALLAAKQAHHWTGASLVGLALTLALMILLMVYWEYLE
jgi:hypothetical protein